MYVCMYVDTAKVLTTYITRVRFLEFFPARERGRERLFVLCRSQEVHKLSFC